MHTDTHLITEIATFLLLQQETISVAESVTAGQLQVALSTGENAMHYFQGGITTYNLGQKTRHLRVEPISAMNCNCVSIKVAAEMARGACELFSSNWGIGVTGYTTPFPEWGVTDPFAFFAIAYHGDIIDSRKVESHAKRVNGTQAFYVNQILEALLVVLPHERNNILLSK